MSCCVGVVVWKKKKRSKNHFFYFFFSALTSILRKNQKYFFFVLLIFFFFISFFRKAHVEGKLKCGGCQNTFSGGDYYNVLGAIWHPECFVCQECDTSFGDYGYFVCFEKKIFFLIFNIFHNPLILLSVQYYFFLHYVIICWLYLRNNNIFVSTLFFFFVLCSLFSRYDLQIHNKKVSKHYYHIVMIIQKHHGLVKNYYG